MNYLTYVYDNTSNYLNHTHKIHTVNSNKEGTKY